LANIKDNVSASRAVGTHRPFRQALAKAFAFCGYLFFTVAKSKALAVPENTPEPMMVGLDALFAIAVGNWPISFL